MRLKAQRGKKTVLAAALAAALLAVPSARAQFSAFHIGNAVPILDETGSNYVYGSAKSIGCLVQIIKVTDTNNPYLPPFNVDGTVNTGVTPIVNGETAIGALTSPAFDRLGLFARTYTPVEPQPAMGSKIFVRVFNAWNMFSASHYGDSDIKTFNGNDVIPVIGGTTNQLDMADSDVDGLNTRWERFLGTDPSNADSDGDHMSDGDEHRAGTSGTDGSVFLAMSRMDRIGDNLAFTWPSVVGKQYVIQCSASLLPGEEAYYPVTGILAATGSLTQVTVQDLIQPDYTNCAFRVLLVE